jgi:hypothetical protein
LHAALCDPQCEGVVINRSVLSWSAVVRSPITTNQLTNVVPGALKSYDLPDVAALMAPRFVTVKNSVNPRLEPVTQAVMAETYEAAKKVNERVHVIVD